MHDDRSPQTARSVLECGAPVPLWKGGLLPGFRLITRHKPFITLMHQTRKSAKNARYQGASSHIKPEIFAEPVVQKPREAYGLRALQRRFWNAAPLGSRLTTRHRPLIWCRSSALMHQTRKSLKNARNQGKSGRWGVLNLFQNRPRPGLGGLLGVPPLGGCDAAT
jgi:hypothetical protein